MIESLPPELFAQVLDHLELADLYPLRLASRHLEHKSIKGFSTAAFSTIRVDFSSANLEWIGNVASRDDLRLAVRSMRVGQWDGKVTRKEFFYESSYGLCGYWPRLEDGSLDYGDSEDAQQFVAAFLRLPNCTTVTVTDERFIEPSPHQTPQYQYPIFNLSSADATLLVLRALSSPHAPTLARFRMCIGSGIDWYRGCVTSTAVSAAKNALCRLTELTLELSIEEDGASEANLLQLLTTRPDLRTLRILWSRRLGAILPLHLDSLPHFTPPRLETLLLWGPRMKQKTLAFLLSNSQDTLSRLDLGHITLTSGSWTDVLEHLRAAPFRRLRRFSMFACRDGPARESIAFCPLWKKHKEREEGPACEKPDVSFHFRKGKTSRTPPQMFHVTGALFEDAADFGVAERALRAMAESSHRCPAGRDPGPPCAEPADMRGVEGEDSTEEDSTEGAPSLRDLWTGLPYLADS